MVSLGYYPKSEFISIVNDRKRLFNSLKTTRVPQPSYLVMTYFFIDSL